MSRDQNHLVWVDMEMTGLEPDRDRVIEVAVVVTNAKLEVVAEGPVIAVHQPDSVLDAMDAQGYDRVRPPLVEFEHALAQRMDGISPRRMIRFTDPVSLRTLAVRSDMMK